MKISNNDKDKLRSYIEEQLKEVPEGTRIHLDKDLLESLLFEEITEENPYLYDGTCKINFNKQGDVELPFKFPCWNGEFLSKIDLSEVSFEGVLWDSMYSTIPEQEKNSNQITFNNTNAKIDFSKAKKNNCKETLMVAGCSFKGTPLTNFEYVNTAVLSNFSKCNLSSKDINNPFNYDECDFSGNDFSEVTIKQTEKIIPEVISNFAETGLNLNIDFDKLDSSSKETISQAISEGKFTGCTINGNVLKSKEENQKNKEKVLLEYNQLMNSIYENINQSIEESKTGRNR